MTSRDSSVIVSGTGNLDNSSVELISVDGIGQHESVQQHQDTDTSELSYTAVPLEVLEAAGVDIENSGELTEEQINTIMSLIEPRAATQEDDLKQEHQIAVPQSSYANNMPSSSSETGDRLTLYILDDGSLKLTDATLQKDFFFTPRELAMQNIDVDNLTDESLQRIIQMAMESNELVVMKRRRIEGVNGVQFTGSNFVANTSMEPPASVSLKKMLVNEDQHIESQLSLIGNEVEIKRDGKVYSATIKYCRQNGGYKVQFSDGHFEWVSEDEIRLLRGDDPIKCTDHESYSETVETMTSGNIDESTISKNSNDRSCISQIPGIKVIPTSSYKQEEPNFCCVVCDQKVYQKEPQYIVIRIPACDKCAEEKMILLDGTTKDCEAQTCSSILKNDFRIANTTNDEQGRS